MIKIVRNIFFTFFAMVLAYGIYYAWRAFPIISGYGAKNICSCIYLSERPLADIVARELSTFPLTLGHFEHDTSAATVTGSVFGMAERSAFYRKGLGCTLSKNRSEISPMPPPVETAFAHDKRLPKDSLWPQGERVLAIDHWAGIFDINQLNATIASAFEEKKPEKPQNTRAVVIVHDGQLVTEAYAEGFDRNMPLLGWSMSKSITNALIGILVKDGKLRIEDTPSLALWTKEKNDPRNKITINHLLRMSSGLAWEEEYSGPSSATNMLFKNPNMGKSAARASLEHPPGEHWYYSSGTSNILSLIIRQTVGDKDYASFPRKRLLEKIGMYSATLEPDASGTYVGSSYTFATARDWARFGLLYYNDGLWNGERILPEGWVAYSTTPTPDAPIGEYGAHFWLNAGPKGKPELRPLPQVPEDMFSANGFSGQRIYIIPSKKLVVVRLGNSKKGNFDYNSFLSGIISSLH